jgi:hypothetical protein
VDIRSEAANRDVLECDHVRQTLEAERPEPGTPVSTDQARREQPVYLVDQLRSKQRRRQPAPALDEQAREALLREADQRRLEIDVTIGPER